MYLQWHIALPSFDDKTEGIIAGDFDLVFRRGLVDFNVVVVDVLQQREVLLNGHLVSRRVLVSQSEPDDVLSEVSHFKLHLADGDEVVCQLLGAALYWQLFCEAGIAFLKGSSAVADLVGIDVAPWNT